MKKEKGITLVALVVTIVVLLILVGITLVYVLGDNSVFKKAQEAKLRTEIAQAREKLEIVLSNVQILKQTNPKYNENDFLNEYIIEGIKEAKIIEDLVVVDGYVFELDRSVPKIGEYIGKREELVFPEINISKPILATDFKSATFTITTKDEKNGISKVQIIQEDDILQEYTYDNRTDEITIDFIAKQNGKYKVKVYSKLVASKEVVVDGIVMVVEYAPNGNEEYKKEHQVKVIVKETTDKVKSMKYQWTNTTVEPQASTFLESCSNNVTIIGKNFTGTYYLWVLLETESGKTNICRSEGFLFDNEGPTVTLTSTPVSETSFTLTATASDEHSNVLKCEFYVEGELKATKDILGESTSYTVTEVETGDTECYVIVTDSLGNKTKKIVIGTTKLYAWEECAKVLAYSKETSSRAQETNSVQGDTVRDVFLKSPQIILKTDGTLELAKNPDLQKQHNQLQQGMWVVQKINSNNISYAYVSKVEISTTGDRAYITWTWYDVKSVISGYTKGELERQVTSISRNAYPDNGEQGEKWYVYKGIQ